MSGRSPPVVLSALALLLPSCRSAGDELADDRRHVESELDRRTGTTGAGGDLAAPAAADDDLPPAALALFADGLTEEEAVRVGLLQSRELQVALGELGIARAALHRAALPPNPIASVNAKFFSAGTEVELGLVAPLFDLLLQPVRERVAGRERDAAEAAVTRTLVHFVFDVRRAVADVRAAEAAKRLAADELDAAIAARDLMRRLHVAGNVTDAQLTHESIAAEEASGALADAALDLADARARFELRLGLGRGIPEWTLAARRAAVPLPPRSPPAISERAAAASLDLAEARAHVGVAAERAGVSGWEPLLSAGQLGLAAKREAGGGWGVGPAGTIALPLFDHSLGGGSAAQLEATARLEQALSHHAALVAEVATSARRLTERANATRERADHQRAVVVPLHERLVRETLQNYNAMQIGVFDVLVARREELSARRRAGELEAAAARAAIDLAELEAGSLPRPELGH